MRERATVLTGAKLVAKAKAMAARAHAGQFRDDGVTPYRTHLAEVAAHVSADSITQAVAWLHDVLEHTDLTISELKESGIPAIVIRDVVCLSHLSRISYQSYLARVKTTTRTREIKISDMKSNLAAATDKKDVLKYAKGIVYLLT